MSEKPDFRDLIVDHPSCRASVQKQHMDGALYEDFEALYNSIRTNSIVRVYRPYLLGGAVGGLAKRRNVWAERADRIKNKPDTKNVKIVSIDPPLSGHSLTMFASKQIGDIARGKVGRSKTGRPVEYDFSPEQWEIIGGIWTSRKYGNDPERLAAIKTRVAKWQRVEPRFAKVPGRTTLRNKFGSPHKGRE